MSITTESMSVTFLGNGTARIFPYSFPIPKASYADVYVSVQGGAVSLIPPTGYLLEFGASTGGTVTYPADPDGTPLQSGDSLIIERILPLVQDLDFQNQTGFLPEVVEEGLDNLEMQIQQLKYAIDGIHLDGANVPPGGSTGQVLTKSSDADGDVVWASSALADGQVSFAKMQDINTDKLIGRDDPGIGDPTEIAVGGGLEFTGTSAIQRSQITGDITVAAGSSVAAASGQLATDIDSLQAADVIHDQRLDALEQPITTGDLADNQVTFGKMQDISTNKLVGRYASGSGDPQEVNVGGGLELTAGGDIQRSALTGAITAAAGSNGTALAAGAVATSNVADNAITYAKMQDVAAGRLLGRDTVGGAGDPTEITVGGGLEFITGGIQRSALTGDIIAAAGSNATQLRNSVALSVIGQTLNTLAPPADIIALTDFDVLRRDASALTFGRLQSESLLVGYDFLNQVQNGDFRQGDQGFVKGTGWTINNDPTNAYAGNYVAVCASTAGGAVSFTSGNYNSCSSGEQIDLEVQLKTGAGWVGTLVQIFVLFYDKDKTLLGGNPNLNVTALLTSSYAAQSLVGAAPAGAAFYRVSINSTQTVGSLYVGRIFAQKQRTGAQLLLDRGTDATKISGTPWGNLIPNPQFATQPWNLNTGVQASARDWQPWPQGTMSIVARGGSAPQSTCPSPFMLKMAPGASTVSLFSSYVDCRNSEAFYIAADIATDGVIGAGNFRFVLAWISADGSTNSTALNVPASSVTSTWTRFEFRLLTSANAAQVRLHLSKIAEAGGTANIYVTNVELTRYVTRAQLGSNFDTSGAQIALAENAVTTGQMFLPDKDNLFQDPLFTDPLIWKAASGNCFINDTTAAAIAATALNCTTCGKHQSLGTTAQVSSTIQSSDVGDRMAVQPSTSYTFSVLTWVPAGFNGMLRLDVNWRKGDKTTISGSQIQTPGTDYRTVPAAANTLATISVTLTSPADVRWTDIRIICLWPAAANSAGAGYISWIRCVRNPPASAVFSQSLDGLAPKTVTAPDTTRYLRSDGAWAVPSGSGTGVTNAYSSVKDGTTTANSSGSDTLWLRSGDATIDVFVGSNDATYGDNVSIQLSATLQATITSLQNVFGAAGAGHAKGLVPDPGATAGLGNFLRDDATWQSMSIADNSITYAKLQDISVPVAFLGRNDTVSGDPTELSVATAKTMLGLTGTNSGDQTITLTGDVTGSGTGSFATAIGPNKVANGMLAAFTAAGVKGATAAGNATDLSMAALTGALSLFTSAAQGLVKASGGGTTNFLQADGNWGPPVPNGNKGEITITGGVWTVNDGVIDNANFVTTMSSGRIKGRITAGAGGLEDLTGAQVTTLLDLFQSTTGNRGLVSKPGTPSGLFLKDDGNWAAVTPANGTYGDITVTGTTWTINSGVVSNAKLGNMVQSTIKGRADGAGTGAPADLTTLPTIDANAGTINPPIAQSIYTSWTAKSYIVGETIVVPATGFVYKCKTAGTSVNPPSGTSSDSTDGGTCHWTYLGTIKLALKDFFAGHLTTDMFAIPNDGVTSNIVGWNKMLAAWNSMKNASIEVPMGAGLVIDDGLDPVTWTDTTERRLELKGQGMSGASKIIVRTQKAGIVLLKTTSVGLLDAWVHDLTFETDTENAGCPIAIRRTNTPAQTNFPQVRFDRVNFRVNSPQATTDITKSTLAYWGDWCLKMQGWHRVELGSIWVESPRNVATQLTAGIAAGATSMNVANAASFRVGSTTVITLDAVAGHPEYAKTHSATVTSVAGLVIGFTPAVPTSPARTAASGNSVSCDFDSDHDCYSNMLGMGALKLWDSYGPNVRKLFIQGGYCGVLHGHGFDTAMEGGNFDELTVVGGNYGYRSATDDWQPGLSVNGNHINCRSANMRLGGPVTTGTAQGGSATTIQLEEQPQFLSTTGSIAAGSKILTVKSMTGITSTWVHRFVEVVLDNASKFRSYCDSINTAAKTITLHDNAPSAASDVNTNAVRMSVLGTTDVVRIVGGKGWGQKAVNPTAFNWDDSLTLTVPSWTDAVAPALYSRYLIEHGDIVGGRKNVMIYNIQSWMAYATDRTDGRHGDYYPTDYDFLQAQGVTMQGGLVHYGGTGWLDTYRRGIAVGQAVGQSIPDLMISGVQFDGNGECCIYNPTDGLKISWDDPSIAGTWGRTFYNGNILRQGGRPRFPMVIHTGGRAPANSTDGTDKTSVGAAAPATTTTLYMAVVSVDRITAAQGIKVFLGSPVSGKIWCCLMDSLVGAGHPPLAWTDPAGTVITVTNGYQAIPFVGGLGPVQPGGGNPVYPAMYGIVPGDYVVGIEFDNSSTHFRTHPFGAFPTNSKTNVLFGDTTQVIAGFPNSFVPDVGPIASLF